MKIKVGVSARHIHLNEEDYKILFKDTKLECIKYLNQPNQFASNLYVSIKTNKDIINNVRVIGPLRNYTQVEISKTDAFKLGINPPIKESGDLYNASSITIISPLNELNKACLIIPNRHIHISKEDMLKYNLNGLKTVSVKVLGEKGGILNNVYLKESDKAYLELHLDTDDANSHLINNNDEVEIIKE
ncbi:MAG: PduL/EutD family phosphate acyltransferase [Bacilli bacterium]